MKKKIFICILLFLLVIVILLFAFKYCISNNILSNEDKQIEVLTKIYKDFLMYFPDRNIVLDDSTLKNFITSQDYSEESQNLLKPFESINTDSSVIYTLSIKYNDSNKLLTVYLSENGNIIHSRNYQLYVKFFNISYKTDKVINLSSN